MLSAAWFRTALVVILLGCSSVAAHAFSATVQQIQQHLATLGYAPGPADGLPGNRTQTAIEEFLRDNGLAIGLGESELLATLSTLAAAKIDPDPETARAIQMLLNEFGYGSGLVPGSWNERSRTALRLFLINENGLDLLSEDSRTAAERHVDVLQFMQVHKRLGETGEADRLFVPVLSDTPCCFSPDSRYLADISEGQLLIWDVASGEQIHAVRLPASSVSEYPEWHFTPEGDHIVTANYAFQAINLETGKSVRSFWARQSDEGTTYQIFDFAMRPGTTEMIAGEGADIVLYDWRSGQFITAIHTYGKVEFREGDTIWSTSFPSVKGVAISDDGRLGASGGTEFGIRIFDLDTRKLLFMARGAAGIQYDNLTFSPDGRYVYAGGDSLGAYTGKKHIYRLDLATQKISTIGFHQVNSIWRSGQSIMVQGSLTEGEYGNFELQEDGTFNEMPWGEVVSPDQAVKLTSPLQIQNLRTGEQVQFTARNPDTSSYLTTMDALDSEAGSRTIRSLDPASGTVNEGISIARVGDTSSSSAYMRYEAAGGEVVLIGGPSINAYSDEDMSIYRDFRVFDGSDGAPLCASEVRADWRIRDEWSVLDRTVGRVETGSFAWSDALQTGFIWTRNGIAAIGVDCGTRALLPVAHATGFRWNIDPVFERDWLRMFAPYYSEGLALTGDGRALLAWRPEQAVQKLDPLTGERIATYLTSFDYQPSTIDNSDYEILRTLPQHTLVSDVLPVTGSSQFLVRLNSGRPSGDFNSVSTIQLFDEADPHWQSAFIVSDFDDWAVSPGARFLALTSSVGLRTLDPLSGQLIANMQSDVRADYVTFTDDGRHLIADGIDGYRRLFDPQTGALLTSTLVFSDGEWLTLTPEGFFMASENGASDVRIRLSDTELTPIGNAFHALYRPDLVAAKLAGDPDGLVAAAAANLDLSTVIDSGVAPRVIIEAPETGTVVTTETIELAASVTDQGGGIGKVEWRVNGLTLGLEARGFDRLAANAGAVSAMPEPVVFQQTLSLEPGNNLIEVIAYNEEGLIASDPASIEIRWDGETGSTPPNLFVLAIGVNDYWDSRLQLNYAVSDATSVADAFAAAGEGLYGSVEVATVLDGDATATGIDAAFRTMAGRIHQRDVFVMFVAGHGKTQDGRYYFLPQDFRYTNEESIAADGIGQDQFQAWLAMVPARKSVLLYDTCDSGSLTGANGITRGLEEVAALSRMTRAMGRTVLSASTDNAPALEGYEGHGVFTHALLSALATGDSDANGSIEVTELASVIDRTVPEISFAAFGQRQVPQMTIMGSDFPLAVPLPDSGGTQGASAAPEPEPPATPGAATHVLILETDVHAAPSADSLVTATLPPGTTMRVVGESGPWRWVERGGETIGFVIETSLAPVQ